MGDKGDFIDMLFWCVRLVVIGRDIEIGSGDFIDMLFWCVRFHSRCFFQCSIWIENA